MPTSRCASTAPAASAGRARPSPSGGSSCTTPTLPTASGIRPRRVRAIYEFHAVERGWGDIGYHLLIDEAGTVYEGRAGTADVLDGGPAVVGGHVYGHNGGTLGIALLGTLIERPPSPRAWRALVTVMAWLARRHDLDPLGKRRCLPHDLRPPRSDCDALSRRGVLRAARGAARAGGRHGAWRGRMSRPRLAVPGRHPRRCRPAAGVARRGPAARGRDPGTGRGQLGRQRRAARARAAGPDAAARRAERGGDACAGGQPSARRGRPPGAGVAAVARRGRARGTERCRGAARLPGA